LAQIRALGLGVSLSQVRYNKISSIYNFYKKKLNLGPPKRFDAIENAFLFMKSHKVHYPQKWVMNSGRN
jgi:hypothetical protein